MANRIRKLREAKGMTTGALAELCSTTQATISRIECDKQTLSPQWAEKIASALGVAKTDLLDDDVAPAAHPPTQIRKFRQLRGMSTADLGARIGMAKSGLSRIETGNASVTLDVLHRIAEALNVSPVDLLGADQESGGATFEMFWRQDAIAISATLRSTKDVDDLVAMLQGVRPRFDSGCTEEHEVRSSASIISMRGDGK